MARFCWNRLANYLYENFPFAGSVVYFISVVLATGFGHAFSVSLSVVDLISFPDCRVYIGSSLQFDKRNFVVPF